MNSLFIDAPVTDEVRRHELFRGQLFFYAPRPSAVALCDFARELMTEAFGPLDPEHAQHHLKVEDYAAILSRLKPTFINHPRSKVLLPQLLIEMGCDPDRTYFDVPRLRSSTSDGYLTTGIAYAWHPHRDTWYSAPLCQVNWWIPIYPLAPDNAMAFHPRYWEEPVPNDSNRYNYYEWNKFHRPAASQFLKDDPRPLPRPTQPIDLDPQLRLLGPPASIIMFSAAQLHSSVPNTSGRTRFSIDFRTVHVDDVRERRGAPNIDSACTGTSLRDFLRVSDLSRLPDDVIALHSDGTEDVGDVTYRGATDVRKPA